MTTNNEAGYEKTMARLDQETPQTPDCFTLGLENVNNIEGVEICGKF